MTTTILLASELHEPPALSCSYFRDGQKPPATRDFAFFGGLLAAWPAACTELLFFENAELLRYALRFQSSDGLMCLPLSGAPAELPAAWQPKRAIGYEEMERYFVSRFFQYRLISTRGETAPRMSTSGHEAAAYEELFERQAALCAELSATLQLREPCCDAPAASEECLVYCPIDGWVAPSFQALQSSSAWVDYLLCPECLGNINFALRAA